MIDVESLMPNKEKRAARREQQAVEVEANRKALRESIAESKRLVDESDAMIQRHRKESEEDDSE